MNNRRPITSKPIRPQRIVTQSIWRVPCDGFVTPRLRREANAEAIGFIHQFDKEDEES